MAYKSGLLTTYDTWDDPPSRGKLEEGGLLRDSHEEKFHTSMFFEEKTEI